MKFRRTILQVIPTLNEGGAERSTVEIAEAVVRAGGRALVATYGGGMAPTIEAVGGEILPLPVHSKNPLTIRLNADRLARLIRRFNVDIVHARSRAPAWSAYWAAKKTGTSLVTTYHGAYAQTGPFKRWYNSSMVRGDRVIANSRFIAETIGQNYQLDPSRLHIIPRGADTSVFNPAKMTSERVAALLSDWGISSDENAFRVLLPARLTEWKGHKVAIAAVALLKEALKGGAGSGVRGDLTVVFSGDLQNADGFAGELRGLIDECGVRDVIRLVGHTDDMAAAYAWADAVISPSVRPEAFGRVAVEAGAMGKPVVATAHGGAQETIINHETGLLAPPGDAPALADALVDLYTRKTGGDARMGEKARARISSLYSRAAMCEATLRVYDGLLREKEKNALC